MRHSTLPFMLAALLVTGCGDDEGDEGGTAGTTTGTTDTTDGTTIGPIPETTTDGTTQTTGVTTTEATTTAGTTLGETTGEDTTETTMGGVGALEAMMSDLVIAQDCMPIVEPDPVGANFNVMLTNTGDEPAAAIVVSATFVDGGGNDVGTIDVTPMQLGPVMPGARTTIPVSKVANSLMPPNGCSVVACDETYTLELEIDVDGATEVISDSAMVVCVF